MHAICTANHSRGCMPEKGVGMLLASYSLTEKHVKVACQAGESLFKTLMAQEISSHVDKWWGCGAFNY